MHYLIPAFKILILLINVIISSLTYATPNQYSQIDYIISPVSINNSQSMPAIKVSMTITGQLHNELILALPTKWAGINYNAQVNNIKLLNKTGHFRHNKSNHTVIFNWSGDEPLQLSYEITQMPNDNFDVHTTIIRNDLIHSPGYGLFAYPAELDQTNNNAKIKYTIKWCNLPPNFRTISSYGSTSQLEFTDELFKLQHALFAAGNLRLYKTIDQHHQPFNVSLYGKLNLTDEVIQTNIAKIVQSERQFFDDHDFPYYLISLLEGTKHSSWGGTALQNCFTAFVPKNITLDDLYILIAHEYWHNWFGANGRIKNTSNNERLNYWWSEGFTDYYARIIALRNGGIKLITFVNEVNEFLRNYYLSPVINEPNTRIKADFWHDYNIEKLPYYRGFVFALYLNGLIQQSTINNNSAATLDNVMLDLFNEAKQQNFNLNFSMAHFAALVKKYLPSGIEPQLDSYITNGDTINLVALVKSLPLIQQSIGSYERGFDRNSFKSCIIEKIIIGSNAYKAGLRNGDKIVSYDFPDGANADQLVTVTINRHNITKIFKYRPENNNKQLIYQLKWPLSLIETQQLKQFFNIK